MADKSLAYLQKNGECFSKALSYYNYMVGIHLNSTYKNKDKSVGAAVADDIRTFFDFDRVDGCLCSLLSKGGKKSKKRIKEVKKKLNSMIAKILHEAVINGETNPQRIYDKIQRENGSFPRWYEDCRRSIV